VYFFFLTIWLAMQHFVWY